MCQRWGCDSENNPQSIWGFVKFGSYLVGVFKKDASFPKEYALSHACENTPSYLFWWFEDRLAFSAGEFFQAFYVVSFLG